MTDDIEFDNVDVLTRIVAPFGSAGIALTQLPSSGVGMWLVMAVFMLGLFIGVNQSIAALDRKLNRNLYEKGLV